MSGGTRHYDFAKELTKRGHKVTIIASSFHYSKYQEMKEYADDNFSIEDVDGIEFIWIKTPPYFGNGISRVKNMLSYTLQVLKIIPKIDLQKPDIIVGSSVHLFAVLAAYKLSKRYETPFVMEVRDLWPQTLIDMGMSKWHPFILLLAWLEKYLYKRADKIISNLPYAYAYIGKFVERDKFVWISNGVDVSNIEYSPRKKSEKFIVSYTGSIGLANNLQSLLDVAKELQDKKDILFRVVGDGAKKVKLQKFVKENNLQNVSIEDSVAKNEISNILQNSDLLYLGLKDSPLYKYGISLNKFFDYTASGRVVVYAGNSKNNLIKDAGTGYTIPPDDTNALKETIIEIYHLSNSERDAIGKKLRGYTIRNYSIEVLANKMESVLAEVHRRYHA